MYASQVWANPFLRQGKEMENPTQKRAAGGAEEDYDGQGHNPFEEYVFMPVLSQASVVWVSTVQLVPGGNEAVQCFYSKQELHCEKDFTSWHASGLTVPWMLVIPNPFCHKWSDTILHVQRKAAEVWALSSPVLLWTSGIGTWIIGHIQ